MSGVRKLGYGPSIRDIKREIQSYDTGLAERIANEAAPVLNSMLAADWDAGRTVYGEARPLGVNGAPLDLYETGKTRRSLEFTVNGTVLRCKLSTDYARFLIGKYRVLPVGDRSALPVAWARALASIVNRNLTQRVLARRAQGEAA